jgi:hypothetical protein
VAQEVSVAAFAAASKAAVVAASEVTLAVVEEASVATEEVAAAFVAAELATSRTDSMVPQTARPLDLAVAAEPAAEDSVGVVDSVIVHPSKTDVEEVVVAVVAVTGNPLVHEVAIATETVKAALATTNAEAEVEAATTSGSGHTKAAIATMLTVPTAPSEGTECQWRLCFAISLACRSLFYGFGFVLPLFASSLR